MKEEQYNSYNIISKNKKLRKTFLVLFFGVLLIISFIFRFYFWPFLFALIFYISLKPLYDNSARIIKNRSLRTFVFLILFIIVLIVPAFFLLVSLTNQSYDFYQYIVNHVKVETVAQSIYSNEKISSFLNFFNINQKDVISNFIKWLREFSLDVLGIFSGIKGFLQYSITFVLNFFFMILILFTLFQEGNKVSKIIYNFIPFPDDIEHNIFNKMKQVIKVLMAGNLVIMFLQGLMVGLAFYVLDFGMPLLAGSIAAVLSLIPVIGTSFIWFPAFIYLLVIEDYIGATFILSWCLFWYLFFENFFKPRFFGKKLHFHPLIFFFLLIGSLKSFGLPGVLIGPIVLTLFFSLWEIYKILDLYGTGTIAQKEKRSEALDDDINIDFDI